MTLEADIKEFLEQFTKDYDERLLELSGADRDTEYILIINEATDQLVELIGERQDSDKQDLINEVLEKIEDLRYEVDNL